MIHSDPSTVLQGEATLGAPPLPNSSVGSQIHGTAVPPEEQEYSPHPQSCGLMRKSL